jgi:hypothetical protein
MMMSPYGADKRSGRIAALHILATAPCSEQGHDNVERAPGPEAGDHHGEAAIDWLRQVADDRVSVQQHAASQSFFALRLPMGLCRQVSGSLRHKCGALHAGLASKWRAWFRLAISM